MAKSKQTQSSCKKLSDFFTRIEIARCVDLLSFLAEGHAEAVRQMSKVKMSQQEEPDVWEKLMYHHVEAERVERSEIKLLMAYIREMLKREGGE